MSADGPLVLETRLNAAVAVGASWESEIGLSISILQARPAGLAGAAENAAAKCGRPTGEGVRPRFCVRNGLRRAAVPGGLRLKGSGSRAPFLQLGSKGGNSNSSCKEKSRLLGWLTIVRQTTPHLENAVNDRKFWGCSLLAHYVVGWLVVGCRFMKGGGRRGTV